MTAPFTDLGALAAHLRSLPDAHQPTEWRFRRR